MAGTTYHMGSSLSRFAALRPFCHVCLSLVSRSQEERKRQQVDNNVALRSWDLVTPRPEGMPRISAMKIGYTSCGWLGICHAIWTFSKGTLWYTLCFNFFQHPYVSLGRHSLPYLPAIFSSKVHQTNSIQWNKEAAKKLRVFPRRRLHPRRQTRKNERKWREYTREMKRRRNEFRNVFFARVREEGSSTSSHRLLIISWGWKSSLATV